MVNEVGIDINLVCVHDHMHSMLQFISGLGYRKAKKLIAKIKSNGALVASGDLLKKELMKENIFVQSMGFICIRVPDDGLEPGVATECDILDQTRIHMSNYRLARYYAT